MPTKTTLFTVTVLLGCSGLTTLSDPPPPLPPPRALPEQAEDCLIQETLEPDLAPRQGHMVVSVEQVVGHTIEEVTLSDGTPIRYEKGGCSHFGMTLTVGLAGVPEDLYGEAVKQASKLDFKATSGMLSDRLIEAKSLDDNDDFGCGDAYCHVRVEQAPPGTQLIVEYVFAL